MVSRIGGSTFHLLYTLITDLLLALANPGSPIDSTYRPRPDLPLR